MLAIRVRDSPCSARLRRSSVGRRISSSPSSSARATVIGSTTVWASSAFGPLTVTCWPSTATSTPEGIGMGILPMRDMSPYLPSPDVGEDFPAYPSMVGLPVGEQPLAGRDDRDTQSAEHPGQAGALGVHPQARLGDPAHAHQGALPLLAVLEGEDERLAHRTLGRLLDLPGGDVALLLEDLGD